jgi:hypothetical protein
VTSVVVPLRWPFPIANAQLVGGSGIPALELKLPSASTPAPATARAATAVTPRLGMRIGLQLT